MLKEITFENFRSFYKETTFSMEADYKRVSEYKNHYLDICNNKILKISSVYGPNGGGKTNLLHALNLLSAILRFDNSFGFNSLNFKCVFSKNENTKMEVFFVTDKFEIGYAVALSFDIVKRLNNIHDDYSEINLKEENVVFRRKDEDNFVDLLQRDEYGDVRGAFLSKNNILVPKLSKTKSIISKLYEDYANNDYINVEELEIIKALYNEILSIMPLDNKELFWFVKKDLILEKKEALIKLLNMVDIKIKDIKIYDDRRNAVYFEREVDVNGEKLIREIPIVDESSGTQKIFDIFLNIISNDNMIFLSNDMNSYLHPKMYRALIEWFTSENNKNCQLIFNSHDIINMNKELFRRDEIWFAYRDEQYSSRLVPLSNIVNYKGEQIRNDATYYKQYLEGKYGADPFIQKGLNLNE